MTTPLTPATPESDDTSTSVPAPIAPIQPAAGPAGTPAPAAPVAAAAPVVVTRKRSAGWLNLLLGAAAVIAVGGVAFAIGRSTAPADAIGFVPGAGGPVMVQPGGSFDPGSGPIVRQGGPGGLMGAGLSMDGTVTAIDADSVTIKLDSGEEVTFDLDAETTYHEATTTDASAIAIGDEVAVQASGGRIQIDAEAGGGTTSNGTPTLSAEDVTVRR